LDHIGPMARSAADAGAILGVIAGRDSNDPTTLIAPVPDYLAELDSGIRAVRIGIDAAYNETGCDSQTVAAVREARKVFETLGATIKEVALPDPSGVMVTTAWGTICAPETALAHKATYPARSPEYGGIRNLIESGRATSGMEVMEAHHKRLAFTGDLSALFADIDLLLIPTQTHADFTIAQEQELFATAEGLSGFVRFATPFDMSGSPTITLPGGFTPKGLPLSFQLVSRHLEEALLVRAGHAYQQVTDWHHRHPSL
jgi:amidase